MQGSVDMDPSRSGNPAVLDALMLLSMPQFWILEHFCHLFLPLTGLRCSVTLASHEEKASHSLKSSKAC